MTTSTGFQLEAGRIPGERIATTIETSDSGAITTTETEVMTVTASVVSGRTYKVTVDAEFDVSAADDRFFVRIREDSDSGNELKRATVSTGVATGGNRLVVFSVEYTADATEDKTFSVTMEGIGAPSGNIVLDAGTDWPSYLYVDYIRG